MLTKEAQLFCDNQQGEWYAGCKSCPLLNDCLPRLKESDSEYFERINSAYDEYKNKSVA